MIEFIKKFKAEHPDAYDLITRAIWTFIECFLLSLPVIIGLDAKALWAAIISAGATAISAVKTLILTYVHKKIEEKNHMEDEGDA